MNHRSGHISGLVFLFIYLVLMASSSMRGSAYGDPGKASALFIRRRYVRRTFLRSGHVVRFPNPSMYYQTQDSRLKACGPRPFIPLTRWTTVNPQLRDLGNLENCQDDSASTLCVKLKYERRTKPWKLLRAAGTVEKEPRYFEQGQYKHSINPPAASQALMIHLLGSFRTASA